MSDDRPALVLDCLGMRCPLPIIELARHIGEVEIGAVLTVLADDPAAASDVPAWCRMRGHDYLGTSADDGVNPPSASGGEHSGAVAYAVRRLH